MADKKAQTLDQLLNNEYGVDTYQGSQTGVVAVGTVSTKVIGANPNRVALVFVNNGINNVYLFTDNTVSATKGFLLAGGGGSVTLNWRDDLVLNAQEWWGIAIGAADNVFVMEVLTK